MVSKNIKVDGVSLVSKDPVLGLPGLKYNVKVTGVKPRLVNAGVQVLYPKDVSQEVIKNNAKMIIELSNHWIFNHLPGVYFSLPEILKPLSEKPVGYKVWTTLYYEPGKGVKPLGFTVHLINTNTGNLIWLYTNEDYGVKNPRTNVRVELSKSFGKYYDVFNSELYIMLLLSIIKMTMGFQKSFETILWEKALDKDVYYSEFGLQSHIWLPHVERKLKNGGFKGFVKFIVYNVFKSLVEYDSRTRQHFLKAKKDIGIGFLLNGDMVISGGEGIIRDVSTVESGLLKSYLNVTYPVSKYNWVGLFIANSQRGW